ncbi:MAG: J domain-containing protein [Candidatus Zixiibacteriota bacterium]|nr:MAG: J domain-containing protein [candidate division Zixibacteria bacterium]
MNSYYDTLGIKKNATQDEIKKAYRKLCKENHPDVNGNDGDNKIKKLNEAYSILSDPGKRLIYDEFGVDCSLNTIKEEADRTIVEAFKAVFSYRKEELSIIKDLFGTVTKAIESALFEIRNKKSSFESKIAEYKEKIKLLQQIEKNKSNKTRIHLKIGLEFEIKKLDGEISSINFSQINRDIAIYEQAY